VAESYITLAVLAPANQSGNFWIHLRISTIRSYERQPSHTNTVVAITVKGKWRAAVKNVFKNILKGKVPKKSVHLTSTSLKNFPDVPFYPSILP
jgi:hypothetical protein